MSLIVEDKTIQMNKIYLRRLVCSGIQLLFILIFPFTGKAQPYVDLLNIKYRCFPADITTENPHTESSGSLSEFSFLLPMEQKNKNVILVGGDYSALHFSATGGINSSYSLYSISLPLGFDQQLKNSSWRRTVLFLPKFNGDFKNMNQSFQAGGLIMYTFKKRDNLKYHFALYYNRECFGDYFLPLVGIDWKINSKLNLFGDLPNNLSLEMNITPAITIGTGFMTTIASYRVHGQGETSYVREGDKTFGHDQVKIYASCYGTKHLVIFAEIGETMNRKYETYDNKNNLLQPTLPINTKDGIFYTAGLAYRFVVN